MRKIILATILALTTTVSFASSYCNSRPSSTEVTRCYNAAIDTAKQMHDTTFQRGMNSSRLSRQNKQLLKEDTDEFINKVNTQCRNHECIYNSLVGRERILAQFISSNSK